MKELKETIIEAVQDATDTVDGIVSISILDHFLDGILNEQCNIADVSSLLQKLSPKEWFENILIGKEVIWGTNSFSDIAAIELIEKYVEYLKQ